jgi:hypothetical protein
MYVKDIFIFTDLKNPSLNVEHSHAGDYTSALLKKQRKK